MTIKGYVELSKENGMKLIEECRNTLNTIEPHTRIVREFSLKKMKFINVKHHSYPFFYQYKSDLFSFLQSLESMLSRPDRVNLSLLSYENLIKLSKGDYHTNPIFIFDY